MSKAQQLEALRRNRSRKKTRAKSLGLCTACAKQAHPSRKNTCDACRARFSAERLDRTDKARSRGLCTHCHKARSGDLSPYCDACALKLSKYNRHRRESANSAGLCAVCTKNPRDGALVWCRPCAERGNARNRARRAQKTCKPKEPSGIINESVTHNNGDTNHGQVHEEARSKSSQSQARQASRQGEVRAEGQSQGQLGHGPNVLGLHAERPQRPNLPEALATVTVFGIAFGLLIAGMLR